MASSALQPPLTKAELLAFNQQLVEVRVKSRDAGGKQRDPDDFLGSLFARIPPPPPAPDLSPYPYTKSTDVPSPDEPIPPFNASLLRLQITRAWVAIANSWVPFFADLGRISGWEDTRRSMSWMVLYFVLWYFKLLTPFILGWLSVKLASKDFWGGSGFAFFHRRPGNEADGSSTQGKDAKDEGGRGEAGTNSAEDAQLLTEQVESMVAASSLVDMRGMGGEGAGQGDEGQGAGAMLLRGALNAAVAVANSSGDDGGRTGRSEVESQVDRPVSTSTSDSPSNGMPSTGHTTSLETPLPPRHRSHSDSSITESVTSSQTLPEPSSDTEATGTHDGKPKKEKVKKPGAMKSFWDGKVRKNVLPVQQVAGGIADFHERVANLFTHTSSPASRQFLLYHFVPIAIITCIAPVELFIHGLTFTFGLFFFIITPLAARYKKLDEALDVNNTFLYNVPTDAQLTLQKLRTDPSTLRQLRNRSSSAASEMAAATDENEIASSAGVAQAAENGSTSKPKKKATFAGFVKRAMELTEEGSQMFAGQKPFDLGILSRKGSVGASGRDGSEGSDRHDLSFFSNWGGSPGHLVVCAPKSPVKTRGGDSTDSYATLKFQTGFTLSGKPKFEKFSVSLVDVSGLKKTGGKFSSMGFVDLLSPGARADGEGPNGGKTGVGEGLEITTNDGKIYVLTNVFRRDELFDRILIEGGRGAWLKC